MRPPIGASANAKHGAVGGHHKNMRRAFLAALALIGLAFLALVFNGSQWQQQTPNALPKPPAPNTKPRRPADATPRLPTAPAAVLAAPQSPAATSTARTIISSPEPSSLASAPSPAPDVMPPPAPPQIRATPPKVTAPPTHRPFVPPPAPPRVTTKVIAPAHHPSPPPPPPPAPFVPPPGVVLGHAQGKPKQLAALADHFPLGSRCNPFTPTEAPDPAEVRARRGVVYLTCHGQWGNRLGEYIAARVAAEALNFGLQVCDVLREELLGQGNLFPNVVDLPFDADLLDHLPWVKYKGHTYPWDELLADSTPRVMQFDGYPFRNYRIFREYREEIRNHWLHTSPDCIVDWHRQKPGPNDIVLHVRAYHGCGQGSADVPFLPDTQFVDPPWEYYARILDQYRAAGQGWDTLWLTCMCGLNHNMTEALARVYGARLAPAAEHHAAMSDWLFMRDAPRLIMSQSTYAWWAAWLGNAREVHYPLVGDWWGKNPRHALFPEEDRFIFHDLVRNRFFLSRSEVGPPG